jgi:hypothetical protein
VPKRRKPQRQFYMPPFKSCGDCSDGWLTDASGAAFRCWCWRAFMESQTKAER